MGRPAIVYELTKATGPNIPREKRTPPEVELIERRPQSPVTTKRRIRTQSSEINTVLDALEGMGAQFSRSGKSRVKVEVPGKGPVFVSSTPSARKAVKRFKADVKRVLGLDPSEGGKR